MGKYLDTNRLMRQCKQIAAKQEKEKKKEEERKVLDASFVASLPEKNSPDNGEEMKVMDARAFEQYLTEFLGVMRESNKRYDAAVLAEEEPNKATQDILHAIELAPSTVDFESLIPTLHKLRVDRRITKKELEVTTKIKDWYNANEKCLNQLMNVLGDIRKILDRQPQDSYCWKTNVIGEKGQWLSVDPDEPAAPIEEASDQLSLFESEV